MDAALLPIPSSDDLAETQANLGAALLRRPALALIDTRKAQESPANRSPNQQHRARLDMDAIREALKQYAAEIAIDLLGEPNRRSSTKRELRFGRNSGSLAVVISGPNAGLWYDHATSEGGDLFDLIRLRYGGGFREALQYAECFIGSLQKYADRFIAASRRPSSRLNYKHDDNAQKQNRERALRLWSEAVPIRATLAEVYLQLRNVAEPALDAGHGVLRFHPTCPFAGERHPCLLALLRDIHTDEPVAIQRTSLTLSGEKIKRMTLGPKTGAGIKITADEDVTMGLTIAEGLETTLSGMLEGFRPAWAVGDADGIENFPVLAGIEALTILVDHDESGAPSSAIRPLRNFPLGNQVGSLWPGSLRPTI
jgi:putative DNA primase/helicase